MSLKHYKSVIIIFCKKAVKKLLFLIFFTKLIISNLIYFNTVL